MSRPMTIAAVAVLAALSPVLQTAPLHAATLQVPTDFATIQAAIEMAKPGDEVLVAPGRYRETIRLRPGITVRSAGDQTAGKRGLKRAEATVIDGAGADASGPVVTLAENATFDGFTVTGVGLFDQKEYDLHHATNGEKLPDERGAVGVGKNFPALSVPNVSATVRHCIVHDNGHAGIGCEGAKNDSSIVNNIVYRNMGGGIGISDHARPTVRGNVCFNNLRGGIGNRNSAALIVENECFDNVRAGIGIREGARPIVRGNKCHKNRRAGIGVRMKGTAPLISGNDCHENAMAGIGCRDGASPLIQNNRCYENTLAGIGCRDGATPRIIGNKCYRNRQAGIGSQLGATPFIAYNECYENEMAGIGQRSDAHTTLIGNHVHHNKRAGIGFEDSKAGTSFVAHNRVIDNALVAVGIHAGWHVTLVENELIRAFPAMPPMVMVFKGAEAEFSKNLISGNGVAGIRTEGQVKAVGNIFTCTTLRKVGPPQFAVWGLPGSDITFHENKVTGWRHALFADKSSVNAKLNQIADYWQAGMRITQPVRFVAENNQFFSASQQPGIISNGTNDRLSDNRVEVPNEKN